MDKGAAHDHHLKPGQAETNLGLQDHMEMSDVEVGDMDDESDPSTRRK